MKPYTTIEMEVYFAPEDVITITSGGEQAYGEYDNEFDWSDIFT